MIRTVLLPITSESNFYGSANKTLKPIFYQLRRESLINRLERKCGLNDVRKALSTRLVLSSQTGSQLEEVQAIWLTPDFSLPAYLMEPLVDKMPSLRWAYWQRSGADNMHCEIFKSRGIALSNSGSLVSRSVAEMNLACILAQAKHFPDHFSLQRSHQWKTLYCDELGTQTTGIIGTGNIARETAKLCRSIGMRVIAASRDPHRLDNNGQLFNHVYHLHHELDMLLQEADYVVVAIPLNEETRNLIGIKQLRKMRETATLINTARHQIVDENALCAALSDNLIAAAYLDVLFNRRLYFWDRVYRTKNLYLTHYSSAHFRNKQKRALEGFLRGLEHEDKTGTFPDRVV